MLICNVNLILFFLNKNSNHGVLDVGTGNAQPSRGFSKWNSNFKCLACGTEYAFEYGDLITRRSALVREDLALFVSIIKNVNREKRRRERGWNEVFSCLEGRGKMGWNKNEFKKDDLGSTILFSTLHYLERKQKEK